MPTLLQMQQQLRLDTRLGNSIANSLDRTPPIPGLVAQCQHLRRQYPSAIHRPTNASFIYNFHGLTFASRRTCVFDPSELRRIIQEDDYVRVNSLKDLVPGDIAIYVGTNGDIEHSGIVVELLQFGPRILSKWGSCHEVVHMVGDCPYAANNVEYHRIVT
jgi:hypothetical protein